MLRISNALLDTVTVNTSMAYCTLPLATVVTKTFDPAPSTAVVKL